LGYFGSSANPKIEIYAQYSRRNLQNAIQSSMNPANISLKNSILGFGQVIIRHVDKAKAHKTAIVNTIPNSSPTQIYHSFQNHDLLIV